VQRLTNGDLALSPKKQDKKQMKEKLRELFTFFFGGYIFWISEVIQSNQKI